MSLQRSPLTYTNSVKDDSKSMTNTLIFVAIFVVLAIVLLIANQVSSKNRQAKQQLGLQWLYALKNLLSNVQKHRGLSNGYLNGDKTLSVEINLLQSKISDNIKIASRVDEWIDDNSRWQGITQHWAKLSRNYIDNSSVNNLKQHNQLIQNILYLIDEIAQEHDLLLLKTNDGKPLHFAWRELLTAAECVGQARAVGTGILASGHCDSVSRIQINYLCQKIERTTRSTWKIMSPNSSQTTRVQRLIEVINDEVIKDKPTMSTSEYFGVATSALDGLHEQYDSVIDHLDINR